MKNIRNIIFFLLDKLKGGPIKRQLDDIERIYYQNEHQAEVDCILKYARQTLPFYEKIKDNNLASFPVVNKAVIRQNFDGIFNYEYDMQRLHNTSTSGSTGEPFTTYQDSSKRLRTVADLIRMFAHFDFYLGDRYVFIRSWVEHYDSSKKTQLKQNFIPIDVNTFDLSKKKALHERLKKDKKICALITYGSALEDFLNYLKENNEEGIKSNLKVIFSCSDALKPEVKALGEKMFNCPIINRYSSEECGIMGYSEKGSDEIKLNIASYHFELLGLEDDEPVVPGTVGRIVVTDLFNKAMPLIRYDTGDLAISDDNGDNVTVLKTLVGRIADTIYTDDKILVSGVTLSSYMQDFDSNIQKYQLICTADNTLEMLVVAKQADLKGLEQLLKKIFGTARELKIKVVDDIPLEKNGKFKQIVNLYKG